MDADRLLGRLNITPEDLLRGSKLYEQHEPRDAMYRVASFLLSEGTWWGKHSNMADALTVLLLTWNSSFYRFGGFDAGRVEACLGSHWATINNFHARHIDSLDESDQEPLESLFLAMLDATQIASGAVAGRRSPVATAKALHLLAPHFLPIWDFEIAKAYDCNYSEEPAEAYWLFCLINQELVRRLKPEVPASTKTLLKIIDQYNYAKYSKAKKWRWD